MSSSPSKKRLRQDAAVVPASQRRAAAPLPDVPTPQHYQVSYMHRQTVTHVCASPRHGYVLTGSADGVVKFWKRTAAATAAAAPGAGPRAAPRGGGRDGPARCLEFVKSYAAHVGPLLALVASQPHGDAAASVGYDGGVKFYDVATFDASGMLRTGPGGGGAANFRLGRHAALLEREELYLVVSTRAPTREEAQAEAREEARRVQRRRRREEESDGEEGPRPERARAAPRADGPPGEDRAVPPGAILLFSGTHLSSEPLRVIAHHAAPVTALAFYSAKQWVVSGDASGVLEVWNIPFSSAAGEDGGAAPRGSLPFASKLETDLYALIKKKTYAIDIAVAETTAEHGGPGNFAVYSSDRKIRLFSFQQCKLVCIYDERMKVYDRLLSSKASALGIDAIEYGKRAALEREMEDAHLLSGGVATDPRTRRALASVTPASDGSQHQRLRMTFDATGTYLLLPTIVGVKVIDVRTHRVVATVGKGDASSLRFLHLCLCPGDAKINEQMHLARMGGSSAAITHGHGNEAPNDSLLVALVYGKRRFYAFSHHDPLDRPDQGEPDERTILARDILNEAPDAADLLEASHMGRAHHDPAAAAPLTTASTAILRTTHGDVTIKLFPQDTPKTIQNFLGHAQSGYYDNIVFHRIIPGFMIQTGDPLGDGTGGESIWGGEFEDEICRDLRHDRPFTVSMANAGPNTNGSQFFITTVPTPWLDNKHTVFGRVTGGMEVVMAIEGVKVDELDRPLSEVKILSVDVG